MRTRIIAVLAGIVFLCAGAGARGDSIAFVSTELQGISTSPDSLVLLSTGAGTTEHFVNGASIGTFSTTDFSFSALLGPGGTATSAALALDFNGINLLALDLTAGAVDFSGAAASTFQFADFILDGSAAGSPLNLSFTLPSGWDPSQNPFVEGVTAHISFDTGGAPPAVVPLPAAAWAGLALLGGLAGVRRFTRRSLGSPT
jgi:hypothetical protein